MGPSLRIALIIAYTVSRQLDNSIVLSSVDYSFLHMATSCNPFPGKYPRSKGPSVTGYKAPQEGI